MGKQERNPQKIKCIFITYNQDKVANTDMSISHVTKMVVIKIRNVHFYGTKMRKSNTICNNSHSCLSVGLSR